MMRRVDIVCIESSGSTEARGTSGGTDSFAERCVKGACVVSCSCTDISSSALTGRLGGTKSGPRRDVASGCGGQKELPPLGYRVLRGSQPVISSSQAPSGVSVCLVRSRNVLCGKRRTRSWKLVASVCVCDIAQSFLGLGKGTQVLYSTSNKRSTLCDPDTTFHTNAFSGRFSLFLQHTRAGPRNTPPFHSRTLVFARSPIPAPFTCCPVPPRSGLI